MMVVARGVHCLVPWFLDWSFGSSWCHPGGCLISATQCCLLLSIFRIFLVPSSCLRASRILVNIVSLMLNSWSCSNTGINVECSLNKCRKRVTGPISLPPPSWNEGQFSGCMLRALGSQPGSHLWHSRSEHCGHGVRSSTGAQGTFRLFWVFERISHGDACW